MIKNTERVAAAGSRAQMSCTQRVVKNVCLAAQKRAAEPSGLEYMFFYNAKTGNIPPKLIKKRAPAINRVAAIILVLNENKCATYGKSSLMMSPGKI